MSGLPERKRIVISRAPWAKMVYVVVDPTSLDLRRSEDVGEMSLAVAKIALDSRLARLYLSHAKIATVPSIDDVVEAVCTGRAQAGLLSQSPLGDARVLDCPQRPLKVLPIPGATFWFGICAN